MFPKFSTWHLCHASIPQQSASYRASVSPKCPKPNVAALKNKLNTVLKGISPKLPDEKLTHHAEHYGEHRYYEDSDDYRRRSVVDQRSHHGPFLIT